MAIEALGTTHNMLALDAESLRAIVENTYDSIVVVDGDGRIAFESRSLQQILGYRPDERLQRDAFELVHPDDLPALRELFAELIAGRADHVRTEVRVRHKDGSWRTLESITTNLLDDPRVRGLLVISRDVTERQAAQDERSRLLESERQARTAAEHAIDQLLSLQVVADQLATASTPESVAAAVVGQGTAVLGALAGRVCVLDDSGKYVVTLGASKSQKWSKFPLDTAVPIAHVIRNGEAMWLDSLVRWAERFPRVPPPKSRVRAAATLPLVVNGRVSGAVAWTFSEDRAFNETERMFMRVLARQCSQALERARLYHTIAEREQRLQALVRQLLTGQEEERRRVAYELHDSVAQVAAGAHQHLQVLASQLADGPIEHRESLERALELAQRTVREARNLIRGLRPTVLDDFGLARAMTVEIEALQDDGWRVTFDERLGTTRLPPSIETALFRALQEALSNIRKHAGQTRVHVSLRRRAQSVRLVVRDWGRGFDVDCALRPTVARAAHVGLEGMHERIGLLGGRCTIRSRPGRGTTVDVSVPVPEAESR